MILPKKVKISEKVLFQEIEGESVLLNLDNEQYFGLNEVGSRFWQLLSDDEATENAVERLKNEFDVDVSILQDDLAVLIDGLKVQGLVTIED